MLLVLDVGNSNTVVGVWEGRGAEARLLEHWRLQTQPSRTADEYRVVLRDLFSLSDLSPAGVSAAILSSVVPPLTPVFEGVCERTFGVTPLQVGPGLRTGMPVRTDNPKEVGADRIVNSVAAYERMGGPLVVVDFGTATTFDAVDEEGRYCGGAIAPGVTVALDALITRTAKLPRVEVARPATAIGRHTVASIQSGVFFGYVGLVDGLVDRIRGELAPDDPERVACMATGGLASLIASESRTITEVDPLLTLAGLRMLYERNTSGRLAG